MSAMRAMVLDRPNTPLVLRERPIPQPGGGEILVEIAACGVCRTDLHVVDGELPRPEAADRARTRDRRPRRGDRRGVDRLRARRARRRAVARRDLRHLSLLPLRAREPVRPPAVHRLHPRRRLRDAYGRRRALLLSACRRRSMPREAAPLLCAGLIGWRC